MKQILSLEREIQSQRYLPSFYGFDLYFATQPVMLFTSRMKNNTFNFGKMHN